MRVSDWSSDVCSSDLRITSSEKRAGPSGNPTGLPRSSSLLLWEEEGGPEQIALDLFISTADLRSGAHHIGRIATVAPNRRNGSVVIDKMTVVQQDTDIVDRSPDVRCHIAVLRNAGNYGILQVEQVKTKIDIHSDQSTSTYRITNLYPISNNL